MTTLPVVMGRITAMYLLTETAADFFPRFGFVPIERDVVPTAVQTPLELTIACPASAQAMRLTLRTQRDAS